MLVVKVSYLLKLIGRIWNTEHLMKNREDDIAIIGPTQGNKNKIKYCS